MWSWWRKLSKDQVPPLSVALLEIRSAEQLQKAWAQHLKMDVEITNSIGMKLRLIPPGEFLIESLEEGDDHPCGETPKQKVNIIEGIYLGKYVVTQQQWKAMMGTEPWKGDVCVKRGDDYAATNVSWDDAADFCKKLSAKEGTEYRLPTEAEWDFAYRAGTSTNSPVAAANSRMGDHAWQEENAENFGEEYAHKVGQKKPNPWGLHDMHRNFGEWCYVMGSGESECWSNLPIDDPQCTEIVSNRTFWGSSWNIGPVFCRSADQPRFMPPDRCNDVGFRVAACTPVNSRN